MSVRLAYALSGPEEAPVLVLGNSLGTTMSMWEPLLAGGLDAHFRVLGYDHRGHGGSAVPPGAYTISDLGGDVLGLLDSLGIGQAAYCGTSLGAMVGIWLAAHAPERVTRLGLCSVSARMGNPDLYRQRATRVRAEGMSAIAPEVVARWFTASFQERSAGAVSRFVEDLRRIPAEGYAGCCEALADMDLRPELKSIVAATLIVVGADDMATPPEQAVAVATEIQGARLESVADAAHLVTVEQPETVLPLLLDHFAPGGERR